MGTPDKGIGVVKSYKECGEEEFSKFGTVFGGLGDSVEGSR
ncbi:MAG: hypothetical protein RML35_12135 [Chloroherpetonaceae bacterium]|nr:hypothetical protein [Chloroherpetonaceae bacterium]MDW8466882.1 hypothetical protein [Chloroherpetonaceae bacterium]